MTAAEPLHRAGRSPEGSERQDAVAEAGRSVAVLEINPSGHRLHYVRHLVDAAGPGDSVVLTSVDALNSDQYQLHAAAMTGSTAVVPEGSRRAVLAAAVAQARARGARRLVVPDGDHYLAALLLLMLRQPRLPLEVRLLLMRTTTIGGPEPLRPATLVKPVLAQLARLFPQVRVLFLTDALGVVSRRRGFVGLQPVKDPVLRTEEPEYTRPAWFPPADVSAPLIGVFGHITARKNLPLLVSALTLVPEAALVVGGHLASDVRDFLDTDAVAVGLVGEGRLAVLDRQLDPDELAAGLAAVDAVAVLNDNDSPSGILAEACVRGTPSLVPVGGWLAEIVETTGIGVSTPLDAVAVAAGIRRMGLEHTVFVKAARRQMTRISTSDFTDGLLSP